MNSKVKTLEEIARITKNLILKDKKIGYAQGCFDILHVGHIELFKTAKKHVDILIIGVEPDEYITKYKGKDRPMFKLEDRLEVLSNISHINHIFTFENHKLEGEEMNNYYRSIPLKLNATHIFANSFVDKYFNKRKKSAEENKITLVDIKKKKQSSSTKIYKEFVKWSG